MSIKIKITLTRDPKLGTDEDMTEAVGLLPELGEQPGNKVVFDIECTYQDEADRIAARFDRVFAECPDTVNAEIEIKSKRGVDKFRSANTPIDRSIRASLNSDGSARTA